jgi:hypothetical protein
MGMYYVCYELSKRGWNAMPTSRNAKGIDILIYNHNASKRHTIQVKSLSIRAPVPLGNTLDHLFADYMIICANLVAVPEVFVSHVSDLGSLIHQGEKNGKKSYWLQPKHYLSFKDNWKIIGNGLE